VAGHRRVGGKIIRAGKVARAVRACARGAHVS
jgi:hypothetical protein